MVTKRSSDGIPAPTISIRAINPATSDSLRKEEMNLKKAMGMSLNKTCGGTETSVEDCIKEITFTQEDVLHDVIFGWMKRNANNSDFSVMDIKSFKIYEDFSAFYLGRYYTFNLEEKLNISKQKTQLFVSLYRNFTYQLLCV